MKANHPKRKGKQMEMAERRAMLMNLRKTGMSVRAMEAQTGIPRSTIQDDLTFVLKEERESALNAAAEYRIQQMQRLEDSILAHKDLGNDPECEDWKAHNDAYLKTEAQLTKLMGTESAQLIQTEDVTNYGEGGAQVRLEIIHPPEPPHGGNIPEGIPKTATEAMEAEAENDDG